VTNTSYVWFEVDVTAHVQAELAQGAVAFALANPAVSSQLVAVQARESSNPAQLVLTMNAAPSVSLTSPANNATFTAPANIALAATAADSDGTIASVEFFHGTTSITTLTAAPYSFTWTGVPQGAYVLTAKATDNLGATNTSAPVNITVNPGVAQLHFIHADHLNSPRLIANGAGTTVWRHDNTEPFNDSIPDENPSGLGIFEFDLGFPGQRRDRETGLWYNDQRDGYDAARGQYTQPEPVGLAGDINLYRYARSNPLTIIDPNGRNPVGGAAVGGMIGGPPGAVVGALVGLGLGMMIANAVSSSDPGTGPVPNTQPAANDPCPDDCQVRQQQLKKEYDFLVSIETRGMTLLRASKLHYNRKAVIHNVVCRHYPVPTFEIGPTGVVP
jgi:RHS repeat-associated protein